MPDFRYYAGVDPFSKYFVHYGVGHEDGGHSGRYAWGSGENPMQDSPLNKGSESRPYTYIPSKSMIRSVNSALKKLQENKITIETIHTARADVMQANQEFLSFIGYGADKNKQKLNREEKTQTVLNVKANNHENRPHQRSKKIATDGTAEVKINGGTHEVLLPSIYNSNVWYNYVPEGWVDDYDLPTIDGTTNEGYRPDPNDIPYDAYDQFVTPIGSGTFLQYYGEEKEKLDRAERQLYKKYGRTTINTVLNIAKTADKVVNTAKNLKNVIVRTVSNFIKHNDEGFLMIEIRNEDK